MTIQSSLFQNADDRAPSRRVRVLIPLPLEGPYDYLLPDDLDAPPMRGSHVIVPLGPRAVRGVVWGPGTEDLDTARLKPVTEILDAPPLPEQLCAFVDWVSAYTLSSPGAVLALALRAPSALEPAPAKRLLRRGTGQPARMTPARERVLAKADDGEARTAAALAEEAGTSSGVVKGLVEAGALLALSVSEDAPLPVPRPDGPARVLSERQAAAARTLCEAVRTRNFAPILLDGVTGSGKTEVYFEAVAEALRGPGQVLILLPEIALTVQFLERFATRFGCHPAPWHSDVGQKTRRRVWRHVASGQARVVVGARSALFLPFTDLSLVVVDEEHETAYKQEEGVIYHARDMAVVRARMAGCPVVLASATPSLETVTNAEAGRYARVVLPARAGAARMPSVEAVDLREDRPDGRDRWLSPSLMRAMIQGFERDEQVLLFLNRRGYAPLVICRACGHRMTAPDTDSWLSEHRYLGQLVCHLTGYTIPKPKICPACKEVDTLHACGPGVERIMEEARERFPDARIALMSSDVIRSPAQAEALIEDMTERRIDLLIGTQMVAKGHNFPFLTLVGVVDADLGLGGGALRAAEKTYQVLHQVAGRAGRADRPGRVLLQTHMPEHPVMQALVGGDRDAFLAAEGADRAEAGYPPFGRLAALILSAPDAESVHDAARALAKARPEAQGITVLGPVPAPIAVLRGRHRMRFLVKTPRQTDIQAFLRTWLTAVKRPTKVRLTVDVDPYSFL
ncbi:MAG: primosomal protein N' [Alphaproteobacteria bacterium]